MYIKITLLDEKVEAIYTMLKERCFCSCNKKKSLVPWLTKEEVMEHLRISKGTYYNWRNQGFLKPVSTHGEDRYLVCQINKIILGRGYRERLRSDP